MRSILLATTVLSSACLFSGQAYSQGYSISLDGTDVVKNPEVAKKAKSVDVKLAEADVQISYDALDPVKRLNVEAYPMDAAGQYKIKTEANYPAFIERGELLLINLAAPRGARIEASYDMPPNVASEIKLPNGNFGVVYRVYDKRGRVDETQMLVISDPDRRGLLADVEEGADFLEQDNIKVRGGAVTVLAKNIAQGGALYVFGEQVKPNKNGGAVIERILPSGEHNIDVEVADSRGVLNFGKELDIETSEWFYVAVADVEFWKNRDKNTGTKSSKNSARVQLFVDGETQNGVGVTASLDTGLGPIKDIISRIDEKDPRALAGRIGDIGSHTTYGDDSTLRDATPTSGRVYLRVEKEENYFLWGDYSAEIEGSEYLRNNRSLYGAKVHYESEQVTEKNKPKFTLDANVAQSDQLFGRDVFRGTDGSVYFLSKQDITRGTERIEVVVRDTTTGRVIERIVLVEGRDYEINSFQGVLRLNAPVTSGANSNLIETHLGGDQEIFVVAQYEYTPIGVDVDGLSAGARIEAWVNNDIRVGVTALHEDVGISKQEAYGVDVTFEFGEMSFIKLDYAQTKGTGFGFDTSVDGGLILDPIAPVTGNGSAYKVEFEAHYSDLGLKNEGLFGGYYEYREEGFSTLDYQVTPTTGDQTLYGVFAQGTLENDLSYDVHIDVVKNQIGTSEFEIGGEISYAVNDAVQVGFAVEHYAQDTGVAKYSRTDVAARISYELSPNTSIVAMAQIALQDKGLPKNNRFAVGVTHKVNDVWSLEANVSTGTTGLGFGLLATAEKENGNSSYFGYEVEPARAYTAGVSNSKNGKFVLGGRQKVSDSVQIYGENVYDILGERKELAMTYGIEYIASDFLTWGTTVSLGKVNDPTNGDIDRQAYSVNFSYEDKRFTSRGRLEYRKDRELNGSGRADTDTYKNNDGFLVGWLIC